MTLPTVTDVRIERRDLPQIPTPAGEQIDRWDTFAVVRCGDIYGEVERFTYWHPKDSSPEPEVVFETRIYGTPEHCGGCDIYSGDPGPLRDLAAVSVQLASLLEEARR